VAQLQYSVAVYLDGLRITTKHVRTTGHGSQVGIRNFLNTKQVDSKRIATLVTGGEILELHMARTYSSCEAKFMFFWKIRLLGLMW
jgi:hypothetical protein